MSPKTTLILKGSDGNAPMDREPKFFLVSRFLPYQIAQHQDIQEKENTQDLTALLNSRINITSPSAWTHPSPAVDARLFAHP